MPGFFSKAVARLRIGRLANQASGLVDRAENAPAAELLRDAVTVARRELGTADPAYAETLNRLAVACLWLGRHDEARALLEEALERGSRALGGAHPAVAETLNSLAELHFAAGGLREALSLHQRALKIRLRALGDAHPGPVAELLGVRPRCGERALDRAVRQARSPRVLPSAPARGCSGCGAPACWRGPARW